MHKIETKPIFFVHSHPIAGWRETLLEKSLLQVKWEESWLLLRYLTRQKWTSLVFKNSRILSNRKFSVNMLLLQNFKLLFQNVSLNSNHFNCKPSRHCLIPATLWAKLPREIRNSASPPSFIPLCTPMRNWFICFLAGLYLMEERE